MGSSIASDPRLDPRIKAMMGAMPAMEARDAESREQLLAEAASDEAVAAREAMAGFMDMVDNEEIAPSEGGAALDEQSLAALRLVLPTPAGERNDDVLFGSVEPRAPGSKWEPEYSEVEAALREGGVELEGGSLAGEVALLKDGSGGGGYEVEVTLRSEAAGVPLPEGYVRREGVLDARLWTRLPPSDGNPIAAESAEYTLRGRALGREDDQLIDVDIVMLQSRNARYRRVGDGL